MSGGPLPVVGEALAPLAVGDDGLGPHRVRRRVLATVVAVLVVAGVVLVVVDPFGGVGRSSVGVTDKGYATALQSITERTLSQQTQVSGTLGFAGESTIRVLAGTAPSVVGQAQGSVSAGRRGLASARSALAVDQVTLADAAATLAADQQRLVADCGGDNSAPSASSPTQAGGGGGGGACASAAQLVSSDRQAQTQAAAKVTADEGQVSSAEHAIAGGRAQLASQQAHETVYGPDSIYTALPSAGRVVHRGQPLFAIDGQPVLLLYGSSVARRAFVAGMSPGPDVAELNRDLDALRYGHGLAGDSFTTATAAAVRALQRAHAMSATGALLLGSVVFAPGAIRVTGVEPNVGLGSSVTPGPLMTVSSIAHVVTIALDTSLEGEVRVGDAVIITLPDNTTIPGRVSYVSSVATSGQNGTTFEVHALPDDPAATGTLDQAPVNVEITTASVTAALVVPVNALIARAGGGFAVEEVSRGAHHLVVVSTGLFDDADGLVQVRGAGLAAGQRVVVPGT